MKTTRGYEFDVLADVLSREIAAGVAGARRKLRKPLRVMTIYRDASESFLPREVLLYWTKGGRWIGHDDADLVLDAPVIDTRVPFSVFDVEDGGDRVLPAFRRRHGLPRHDGWGERLAVPRILLGLELSRAYLRLPGLLAGAGVPLARDFQLWDHSPDGLDVLKESSFDEAIRADLRRLVKTEAQLRELAALCYADADRQTWLIGLGLAGASKARSKTRPARTGRANARGPKRGASRPVARSAPR